jgi:hypothetical protein
MQNQVRFMLVGVAVGALLWPARMTPLHAQGQDASDLRRLEERIAAVERTLSLPARDADGPGIAARLTTVEAGLRELARANGQAGGNNVGDDLRSIQDATREARRTQDDLASRVAALEKSMDRTAASGQGRPDTRDLENSVRQALRDTDQLNRRMSDLERSRDVASASDVRDLRSAVADLRRTVDDLRSRGNR